ncbi:hypothetical protein VTK73DRAFT_5409 [Phialemonium thermophilum]|uniref:Uncharacterized protein n=1 Tax=Phialemonium thermophilum TaxID=223376 RepID=A0ABR3V309_9PEZI
MADYVHRRQPQPVDVRVLHRPQAPGLLLPVLQGQPDVEGARVDGAGDPARVRADEEPVSGHAGAVQRVQAAVPERAAQDAGRRRRRRGQVTSPMGADPEIQKRKEQRLNKQTNKQTNNPRNRKNRRFGELDGSWIVDGATTGGANRMEVSQGCHAKPRLYNRDGSSEKTRGQAYSGAAREATQLSAALSSTQLACDFGQ